ncbi:MAG TPA: vWA domain-containing protein, partial [Polyangiaceae bacterium]|nr:vWA domain-containing protein [Polyangiaceae bacterium]
QTATTVPVSIYVLLDQSGSMTLDGNRWAPVTAALKSFFAGSSLSGVGVGLQYFPLGATTTSDPNICVAANYSMPDVPVQDMPANDAALAASIDKHFFTAAQGKDPAHWGTPTYPALDGSYTYLRQYLTANPSRRGVLLLATDGQPSKICAGDTIAQITTLIAAQAAMVPAIQTYVVGIGNVANLNNWAMAGGTGHPAFIVDGVGTTTQDDLAKALDEIRVFSLPCDYAIPMPEAGTVDPAKVNVQFTPPGQASTVFPKVDNVAACDATQPTWYYDDPSAPTRVVMCPAACNALHQNSAKIDILFGCTTEVFMPK